MCSTNLLSDKSLQPRCATFINNDDCKANAEKFGSECRPRLSNASDFRLLTTCFEHNALDKSGCTATLRELFLANDGDAAFDAQQKYNIRSDAMIATSKMLECLGQNKSIKNGEEKSEELDYSLDMGSVLQSLSPSGRSLDFVSILDGESSLHQEKTIDKVNIFGKKEFSLGYAGDVPKTGKPMEPKISTQSLGAQTPHVTSPLHDHHLSGIDAEEAQDDKNADPDTPPSFSPLHGRVLMHEKYGDASKQEAFQKSRHEAQYEQSVHVIGTSRATSSPHDHCGLSGAHTDDIERTAFKNVRQGTKVEAVTDASDSVCCSYPDACPHHLLLVKQMSAYLLSIPSDTHTTLYNRIEL